MKKSFYTLMFIIPFTLLFQSGQNCTEAIPVNVGTYTLDTIDGEAPLPVCITSTTNPADNGEWYIYTAPTGDDTFVTVTSGLQVNFGGDTRLQIYSGDCSNLNCLIGDDDGGSIGNGFLSIASFQATAGESYYIA